jgi:hypothetical protein
MKKKAEKTVDTEKKKSFFGSIKIFSAVAIVVTLIGGIIFKMFTGSKDKDSDDSIV